MWTIESLATELQASLPVGYEVTPNEKGIGLFYGERLLGYAELNAAFEDATIAFSVDCAPGLAAEMALALDQILPTYVDVDVAFEAERLEELYEDAEEVV